MWIYYQSKYVNVDLLLYIPAYMLIDRYVDT